MDREALLQAMMGQQQGAPPPQQGMPAQQIQQPPPSPEEIEMAVDILRRAGMMQGQ